MENNKVKILVASHKPDKIYQDNIYTPIHVGRAISKFKEEMNWMIGDDTGDNISIKNPNYCELTAQYWAWKNLKDTEYIGLCHYRRYFETQITNENIDKLLGRKYDVILPRPIIVNHPVGSRLIQATCMEDIFIFISVLKKLYPDYVSTAIHYLNGNKIIAFNMFVMPKYLFDQYAQWEFSILNEMEKYVKLSGYSRMRRLYGYIAEAMLPIYAIYHKWHIHYDKIVSMIGEKEKTNKIREFYNKFTFYISAQKVDLTYDAVKIGLKNDGIIVD
jgi:hypothetical protein